MQNKERQEMPAMFEMFASSSGDMSARHIESGVLIHSAIDPLGEARAVAGAMTRRTDSDTWLIGNGLGYLSNELREAEVDAKVIEPFSELRMLCATRSDDSSGTSVGQQLADLLFAMGEREIMVYIAPYVRSLIDRLPSDVANIINEIAVLSNSRDEYASLIRANVKSNAVTYKALPLLRVDSLTEIAIACGSGPSLQDVLPSMKESRAAFSLVACSSAVPALIEYGLTPDWTVALEAHPGVARDVELLPPSARVVVFEWTDPQVLELSSIDLRRPDTRCVALETGGGTTLLTAADLASQIAREFVYLAGADLSWAHGLHSIEDGSKHPAAGNRFAPKFTVMRNRIEQWIAHQSGRNISHVVADSELLLKGARHVQPSQLANMLAGESESVNS